MDIYKENLLDHYRNPRNKGDLHNPDYEATSSNASCGDKISIQINLDGNIIKEIKFKGHGCVVSQATASLLTEEVKGMSVLKVKSLNQNDIYELLGTKLDAPRTVCAMLSLNTLKKAFDKNVRN